MKLFPRIATLAFAMVLALTLTSYPNVAAQDTGDLSDTYDDIAELDGLESGVVRSFNVDYSSLFAAEGSPPSLDNLATPASPSPLGLAPGLFLFTAGVLQFDSEDSAAAAVEDARSDIVDEEEGSEIEVEGLDGATTAFTFEETDEFGTFGGTTIVTQDGDQVVLVLAAGLDFDTTELASEVAVDVVGAEAGSGEPAFSADGTSSGGLWDKLPASDDDAFEELPIVEDAEIVPDGND
jgi:hypothetical protein